MLLQIGRWQLWIDHGTVEISLFPLKYSFELPIEPLLNMIDEVINSVKYRIVRVQSSVENVVFIIKPLVEKYKKL